MDTFSKPLVPLAPALDFEALQQAGRVGVQCRPALESEPGGRRPRRHFWPANVKHAWV